MRKLAPAILAPAAALALLAGPAAARAPEVVPGQYIVAFQPSVADPGRETDQRERAGGFRSRLRYGRALKGFAARLNAAQLARLRRDPEVAFVSPDRVVRARGWVPLVPGEPTPPTGVRRIEAATTTAVRQASDVGVAVIDTGIDLAHPDLDAVDGKNCTGSGTAQDDHGHGTHVAGSIAARNDGAGVVGVAPGTAVHAVKVLGSDGSGTTSTVVCGIDWVTANAAARNIEVANMSLGGSGPPVRSCATTTDAEHKAICNSTAAGITYVVAAGNDSWDFDFEDVPDIPAAYPEVLTVTAMSDTDGLPGAAGGRGCGESDDTYASFSNFAATAAGEAHTIAAPGVCIRSTLPGGAYDTWSGTSMATPHVAGSVALCHGEGSVAGPCAGLSPAQVIQRMRTVAQERTVALPAFGFAGDPLRAVAGQYYGYLDWDDFTGGSIGTGGGDPGGSDPGAASPQPAAAATSSTASPPAPTAPPAAPARVDRLRPGLAFLRMSARTFRAARGGPIARSAAPVGTRVSWRLTERARVVFRVQRAAPGRRVGRRCVRPSRATRRRSRCTRWLTLRGRFARAGVPGANSLRFLGRLGGRALVPGRHRLVSVATDAAGNRSAVRRLGFRIVRR